ncbi:MAG: hypothetical protein H6728_06985 [Myxococcales bacterium]|nr:hypothetical protein [Myxococcales bacterium]
MRQRDSETLYQGDGLERAQGTCSKIRKEESLMMMRQSSRWNVLRWIWLWAVLGLVACQPTTPASTVCSSGQARCGEACVDLRQDDKNCGACGKICRSDEKCDKGFCILRCESGTQACGDACVDVLANNKHCGLCGKACASGEQCTSGQCVSTCPPNLPDVCDGTCVDLQRDRTHCGKCGETCAAGRLCTGGRCLCPQGQFLCGSFCVDPMTSTSHCGDCKRPCAEGQLCASGTCVPSCPAATPTVCLGGCIDTQSNRLHCGACGRACGTGQRCVAGQCLCPEGLTQCGDRCVDLFADFGHCGACGQGCAKGQVCAFGGCVASCPAATPTACFGGCVDPQSNRLHCGACGQSCGFGQTCVKGQCTCPPGQTLCDGACVNTQSNYQHCGKCLQICAMGEVCGEGTCQTQCPAATPTTCFGGCVDLQTDSLHCGSCGKQCGFGKICDKGACICPAGFELCAGQCEDLRTSRFHCGACGRACGPSETCLNSNCVAVCQSEAPERCGTSCVNTKTDVAHCGGCDKACSKGERCRDSLCVPECPTGQALCGTQCFDLQRSDKHCGACGNACSLGSFCDKGTCVCTDGAARNCYFAPPQTLGIGPCRSGVQRCGGGTWGACTGQVLPSLEVLTDRIDNDCDGKTDESVAVKLLAGNSLFKNGGLLESRFHQPSQVVSDGSGNLYLADTANNVIRKIDPQGNVTTFAGTGVPSLKDGSVLQSSFNQPEDLAFDTSGNLYIADTGNHAIRKIDPQGKVSTIAGNGTSGYQDGASGQALFFAPRGIAVADDGSVYVADTGNHVIRKIDTQGVGTIAGDGTSGFKDDTGKAAQFYEPTDIIFNRSGDLFVADSQNHRIRKIDAQGVVSTYAGSGTADFLDGTSQQARFKAPRGLLFDGGGNLYVADAFNHRVRKIDNSGNVTTIAGTGDAGFKDDTALNAQLYRPSGLSLNAQGELLIIDTENKRIRKLGLNTGTVTTLTGDDPRGYVDGPVGTAKFNRVSAMTSDPTTGIIYVADTENHRIRKVDLQGNTTTLSGTGQAGYLDGDSATARFSSPRGIYFSLRDRILYVSDARNHRIRKVDLQGNVTTLAGDGTAGMKDGAIAQAQFNDPQGISADEAKGILYIADTGNHAVRQLDLAAGTVGTLAGNGTPDFVDGDAAKARFRAPQGVTWRDQYGVYVADTGNYRLRLINTKQVVSTLAGNGQPGINNGEAVSAGLLGPVGVVVGRDGKLYVSDQTSLRVIEDLKGMLFISTYAGGQNSNFLDGDLSVASFGQILGLVQRYDGGLVAADQAFHNLRIVQ